MADTVDDNSPATATNLGALVNGTTLVATGTVNYQNDFIDMYRFNVQVGTTVTFTVYPIDATGTMTGFGLIPNLETGYARGSIWGSGALYDYATQGAPPNTILPGNVIVSPTGGLVVSYKVPVSSVIFEVTGGAYVLTGSGAPSPENVEQIDGAYRVEVKFYNDATAVDGTYTYTSGPGDDTFDGGLGFDKVVLSGDRSDYRITLGPNGTVLIVDQRDGSPDGTDTISGIEKLVFADRSYNLEIGQKVATVATEVVNDIIDLYVAYFNRAPEAAGLGYWIDQLKAGMSLTSIATEFYKAGIQFSGVTGYTSNMPIGDFIEVLYRNVLARTGQNAPSEAEVAYWIEQVQTGAVSREGLVARFLDDARLFYDDPVVGYVPRLLDQKVEFGRLHAVTYGLDYNDNATSIATTVALAAAVTPTGFEAAVTMVGLSADDYLPI